MNLRIALAGNPNTGKTTLFNGLTGSNQFVGNWPGVTVEKKEGRLKNHDGVMITDLPGIYSLSPYTLEEVVARNYLIEKQPDVILNIVDGTNLERNLYLTTQLMELGIPVVVAVNMMDLVKKSGGTVDTRKLSKKLGCPLVEISALRGDGIMQAAETAITAAREKCETKVQFSEEIEAAITYITQAVLSGVPEKSRRWYAVKVFERDEKVLASLKLSAEKMKPVEEVIQQAEEKMDDDAESIITGERYAWISEALKGYTSKGSRLSLSDKIDRVVTNRWLGLPIFAAVMFCVYYLSMVTIGTMATDWANDGLFGDGWHLFGIGTSAYSEASEAFQDASQVVNGYIDYAEEQGADVEAVKAALDIEAEDFDSERVASALADFSETAKSYDEAAYTVTDEETLAEETVSASYADYLEAVDVYSQYRGVEPDPADYGIWVPGVPVLVENGLTAVGCADWLQGLILDGIVAGVGGVLGFVPQMLVLFLLLAFLEACGYMARIAFVLDRIFRRFGLSGKSFIPILIGTGCGVPGIMASRTIENEQDRRMTVITTTFIPCSAKTPFIAMIAGAIFGGSAWVAVSSYFVGLAAIIVSGIMLKKTRMFAGDPAPFVMELPAYHMPLPGGVLRSMWERGWSFIKRAGTIILLSTILVWFTTRFGFVDGSFTMLEDEQIGSSILAVLGSGIAWIFRPLGWGNWQAAVASITGLVAKENIVGTMGVIFGGDGIVYENIARQFTLFSGYSFLIFNLLCAPCFAAIGAIRREMNSAKWTWFAVGYQCGFAYAIALIVYQFGMLFAGNANIIGVAAALILTVWMLYMLFKPAKKTIRSGRRTCVSA